MVLFVVIGVLFAVAAGAALIRIVRGPSILDRVIASDVLITTLMLVVGAEMVYNGHSRTIPVMIVIAGTASFATIAVARFAATRGSDTMATSAAAEHVPGELEEEKE